MECLATSAATQAQADHALTLAGAASALRQRVGAPLAPAEQSKLDKALADARTSCEAAGLKAWMEGWNMSEEEAIRFAFGDTMRNQISA